MKALGTVTLMFLTCVVISQLSVAGHLRSTDVLRPYPGWLSSLYRRRLGCQFPGRNIDVIVSVGTGTGPLIDPLPPTMTILSSIKQRLTSTEPQHLRFIRDYPDLNDVYFRFQTEGALGEINLGASDKMKEIERLSKEYLNTEASRQKIANCTVKFVQSLYDRI